MLLVELHCVPAVLAPVLPVLHQCVNRNFSLAEFGRGVQNFLLAVIPLPTLPVSVGPLGKQRRFAGELAVIGDDAVQLRAIEEVVINGLPHFGTERRRVLRRPRLPIERLPGRPCAETSYSLFASRSDVTRSRSRSPHVLQIDHVLPVHFDHELIFVVAAQQKAVTAFRAGSEFSLPGSRIDGDGLVGRIEVGQGRIVPQNAVSLARQQKRNRNVRVRLVQANGNSTNIENAFLMLSQTVQGFIGGRKKTSAALARSSFRPRTARQRICRPPSVRPARSFRLWRRNSPRPSRHRRTL